MIFICCKLSSKTDMFYLFQLSLPLINNISSLKNVSLLRFQAWLPILLCPVWKIFRKQMKTNKDVIYHSSSTKLLCERKTQQVSTSPPAPGEPGQRQFTLQSLSGYKDISNTPPCPSPKCRVTGRSKCSILIFVRCACPFI